MTISFELWQFLTLLGSCISLILVVVLVLGKLLLAQHERAVDLRFAAMTERFVLIEGNGDRVHELELRLERWRAELHETFVGRNDYIRGQTVIEAKLDAQYSKVELLQLHVAKLNNNRGQS